MTFSPNLFFLVCLKSQNSDFFMKSKDEGKVKLRPYDEAEHPDKAMHFSKIKDKSLQILRDLLTAYGMI